jgi:hypothetical protein
MTKQCEHLDTEDGICLDCGFDNRAEIMADAIDRANDLEREKQ